MLKGQRRTVTITPENYDFICKQRGGFILKTNQDKDFTTTLNDMIKFAKLKGFDYLLTLEIDGCGDLK